MITDLVDFAGLVALLGLAVVTLGALTSLIEPHLHGLWELLGLGEEE